MTLPDERYRAVMSAQKFLFDLCDSKKTPRVPKAVRQRASAVLRHFPSKWEMDVAATRAPSVFQTRDPVDNLTMMILDYEGKK